MLCCIVLNLVMATVYFVIVLWRPLFTHLFWHITYNFTHEQYHIIHLIILSCNFKFSLYFVYLFIYPPKHSTSLHLPSLRKKEKTNLYITTNFIRENHVVNNDDGYSVFDKLFITCETLIPFIHSFYHHYRHHRLLFHIDNSNGDKLLLFLMTEISNIIHDGLHCDLLMCRTT